MYRDVQLTNAELGVSLPPNGGGWWNGLTLSDEQEDRLIKLADSLKGGGRYADRGGLAGQLLGFINFPNASPPDPVTYGGRAGDDWMSLLEVQSVGSMMWSDEGTLNVLIRRSDLAAGDFSDLYATVYSS